MLCQCVACSAFLRKEESFFCDLCTSLLNSAQLGALCPHCLEPQTRCLGHSSQTSPTFKTLLAGFELHPRIEPGFRFWKTHAAHALLQELLKKAALLIHQIPKEIDGVIPVPHSAVRKTQLAGGSSERLAQALALKLQCPYLPHALLPAKHAQSIAALSLFERQKELQEHRFRYNTRVPIKGQSFLLVDDFLTSGLTLQSAAQTLKSLKSKPEIHGFVLAARWMKWDRTPESATKH